MHIHFAYDLILLCFLLLCSLFGCLLVYLQARIVLADDSFHLQLLVAIDKRIHQGQSYCAKLPCLLSGSHGWCECVIWTTMRCLGCETLIVVVEVAIRL